MLLQLQQDLQANQRALLAGAGDEALHDFRIAIRKTRTLLSQMDDVLPEPGLSRFRDVYADLMDRTGRLRDLEVCIATVDNVMGKGEQALEPLQRHLLARDDAEREHLLQYLQSDEFSDMMQDWQDYLAAIDPETEMLEMAYMPLRILAAEAIRYRYLKTARLAHKVNRRRTISSMHKIRKSAKRLRYLLDLFAPIFPEKRMKKILKELKRFQDVLGQMQDIEVQTALINESAVAMGEKIDKPAQLAIRKLLRSMEKKKKKLKPHALKLIAQFPASSRKKLDKLLKA